MAVQASNTTTRRSRRGDTVFNFSQVGTYDDRQMLSQALMRHINHVADLSVSSRKRFSVALSGGSLVDSLAMALDTPSCVVDVDWSTWHVFWADERWVSWQHPASNYGTAYRRFLCRVPIPETHIHAIDTSHPADECARQYADVLKMMLQPAPEDYPQFDLILLGIGPDGHTASLFPDHPVLHETQAWVSPVANAPKPPPQRISLTLPVINHARHIAWVVNGPRKADIVARMLKPLPSDKALPAGRVNPTNGETRWFLDQAAAAGI